MLLLAVWHIIGGGKRSSNISIENVGCAGVSSAKISPPVASVNLAFTSGTVNRSKLPATGSEKFRYFEVMSVGIAAPFSEGRHGPLASFELTSTS